MQAESFERLYSNLNPQQQKAVDLIEGAVMVIAGPGTGKTQVLTLRIANILRRTNVEPENILALTFTESGVSAMRKRLVSIVGEVAFRVNIFTFHSFANFLIQSYPDEFETVLSYSAITELEQVEILQNILDKHSFKHIKPVGEPYFYLRAIQSAISELKRENISTQKFAQALKEALTEFEAIDDLYHQKGRYQGKMKGVYQKQLRQIEKNQDLLQVYHAYQNTLQQQQYYDFDDMLLYVIREFESNQDFLLQMQEQYQYILIDEHQDTNRAQNRIIQLLASYYQNPNVFAVGDAKQAIYRFQGASLANFLRLKQLFPAAQTINLVNNYRSTQLILDASQALNANHVSTHTSLAETQLQAQLISKQTQIRVVDLPNFFAEYHFVADDIEEALSTGISPEEIAVLARNNADLYQLTSILEHKKIPYVLESSRNILQEIPVKRFILLLETVAHIGDDTPLVSLLSLNLLPMHPIDVYQLKQQAEAQQQSLWQTMASITRKSTGFIQPAKLQQAYQTLLGWQKLSQTQTLDQVFSQILLESGFLHKQPDIKLNTYVLGLFANLYQQVNLKLEKQPNYSLKEFLDYLRLLDGHGLSIKSQLQIGQSSAVRLMTAHAAKGLEFDRVYILNVYDGKWGNKRGGFVRFELPYRQLQIIEDSTTTEDKNADDRRLLYVALTRARQQAILSFSQQRLDGTAQIPSQFITEIGDDYVNWQDTTDFENKFSSDLSQIFLPSTSLNTQKYQAELKEFVKETFDRNGLSATALNAYLSCPWRYYFQQIMRLPQEKSLPLILGNVIHQIIHQFLLHPDTYPTVQKLLTGAEELLNRQPLTSVEKADVLQKINQMLPTYFSQRMQNWNQLNKSELWVSGIGIGGDIKLKGKIDMLEPVGTAEYRVYDFKTGKPKSRNVIEGKTKSSDGNLKRQLVFYQLLMNRYQGGRMKMVEGVIEFVEPTSAGQIKSESFVISSEEEQELEATIIDVANQIRTLSFWEKTCEDPGCLFCGLRQMMA